MLICAERRSRGREEGLEQKEGPGLRERARAPGGGGGSGWERSAEGGGGGVSYIGLEPSCVLERGCG